MRQKTQAADCQHAKGCKVDLGAQEGRNMEEVMHDMEKMIPPEVRKLEVEFQPMTEEQRTLEARLNRSLPATVRELVVDALK